MKKISVIIPCYNVERWIDRCMKSIAVQTFGIENLEVICVDDASTDSTWEHLQKWEQQYPDNVLLIRQAVNQRQGAARNLGLQYASSDWIAFVDADDWLEADYFERLYDPVMRFACDMVSCGWGRDTSESLTYFDDIYRKESNEEHYIVADTTEITRLLLVRSKFIDTGVWGKIIRKNMILEHHMFFPENLTYEDMYWRPLLDIYAKGIYLIDEKLYHYFENSCSTVLSLNADHHMDWITMQMKIWTEYHKRGLWDEYHEEIEFALLADAVGFLKLLVLRYEKPSFSIFQLEKNMIRQYVSDYRRNKYVSNITEVEIHDIFLKMLYSDLDKKGFQDIVEDIKNAQNTEVRK